MAWVARWQARQVDCADLRLKLCPRQQENLDPVESRCSGKPPRQKQMTLARNKITVIQDRFLAYLFIIRLFTDHSYIIVSVSITSLCLTSFSFPTCSTAWLRIGM